MQTTYQHPWYIQQQKQESTTTCESESTQSQASETPGPKLTDEGEIQWAAGLFEGEGSLSKGPHAYTFSIEMTDEDVIKHFASIHELTVYELNRKTATGKTVWRAKVSARDKIFAIVCDFYPYLGARRRETCDQFLQWYAEKEGMKYD